MKKYFLQLGKDSVIYGIGGIAAKSIGFFLLPVYTRIFSPSEYGVIEMLVVLINLLGAVLNMGLDSAQSFFFFEQKKTGQKAQSIIISATLHWRLLYGIAVVFITMFFIPVINEFFFENLLTFKYFVIAFLGSFFSQILRQSVEVFRLLYKPWRYIGVTLGQTLASAAITIFLVVSLNWSVYGYIVGFTAGTCIAAVYGIYIIRNYLTFSKEIISWWPKLIKFGLPFVPAALTFYILNTSDRWFINYYHGQDALGLYGIGAKFAVIIFFVVVSFRRAWWPVALDVIQTSEGADFLRFMSRLYLGIGIASVILLTVASPLLVQLLTTPDFYQAFPIIGILSWYSIFYGFQSIISIGIWKKEKTKWVSVNIFIASLANIFFDFLLVPTYGGLGAAIATSTSFLIWNIITLFISEKFWYIGYPVKIFVSQIVIGILACSGILYIYLQDQTDYIPVLFIFIISTGILLKLTINMDHLKQAFKLVRNKITGH